MNKLLIVPASLIIAACSSTTQRPQEIEAVRDYVVAAELEEVHEIRMREQLNYTYVNDRYVTIDARRGDYLVEFNRDCWELRQSNVSGNMVDVRDNYNVLRSRFDTIRGCRIGKIYEITADQRVELTALGDAPGDEVFLPGEE